MEQIPDISDWDEEWLHQTLFNLPSFNLSIIPDEEKKIRNELEIEIEKDLEKEIKDGICGLALRLHGLYRYRKRKNEQLYSSNETCSEVNITIGMDGDCKVEMYERKASVTAKVRPRSTPWSEPKQSKFSGNQRFNWSRTLRDGSALISDSPSKKKRHGVLRHGEGHNNKIHDVGWRY